jgi:hypothetical protein
MASEETPNMPPTRYEYAPPPRPNIIAMATEPPSIGSSISICCQRPPVLAGISGGGSTSSSPVGISGAGRRGGRLMTTLLTLADLPGRLHTVNETAHIVGTVPWFTLPAMEEHR